MPHQMTTTPVTTMALVKSRSDDMIVTSSQQRSSLVRERLSPAAHDVSPGPVWRLVFVLTAQTSSNLPDPV
jgi:hypothetical protein